MQVVYFVNSGSEANELAMLMARLYTGSLEMISLRNGYHGGSSNTMSLTALNTWKYPIPQVCLTSYQLFQNLYLQSCCCELSASGLLQYCRVKFIML